MQVIYNSANYYVLEFPGIATQDPPRSSFGGGFEILDKSARREIFLAGALAEGFRQRLRSWAETPPSLDEVDEFLGRFQGLAQQPLVLH